MATKHIASLRELLVSYFTRNIHFELYKIENHLFDVYNKDILTVISVESTTYPEEYILFDKRKLKK